MVANHWYIAIGVAGVTTGVIMSLFGYLYSVTQKRIDSKQDKSVCEPMIATVHDVENALNGPDGLQARFASMDTKIDFIVDKVKGGSYGPRSP